LEEINSQINKKQSFSELYAVKQRVSALYFQLILNQKQMELTQILENTLNSKMKELEAGLQNGILLSTVTNNLKVEIAKLNQQKTELQYEKLKLLSNLKLLTGLNLTAETQFKLPENEINMTQTQSRIEMEVFDLQKKKMEQMKSLSSSKNLPMVYSFANLGYGRPGYNMLSNDFQDFQMIGVGMSWKLWNWNEYKRDRQILDLSSQSINIKKENFEIEIQMALDQQIAEIKKMNELITSDEEIIRLRSQIAETTNVQLMNGTATPAQYIDELNKLNQAKLENELHKIKLSLAQINYLWIMGKL
jgi:outer membrane protein TolC